MKRRKKGFTLIELIVVVAILVLLMLMLVPKLTGFTKTASDTVCHANQANAYKIMVLEYTLGEKPFNEESAKKAIDEKLGDHKKLCPTGGTITVLVDPADPSKFSITCSNHGGSEQQILGNYSKDMLEMAVNGFYGSNKTGQLDSTGPNFGKGFKQTIAKKYGLNANNFDFTVMKNNNGTYSVYIFDGISDMNVGDSVQGVVYEYDKDRNLIGSSTGKTFTGSIKSKKVDSTTFNYLDLGSVK